jgi:ABC-type nitrate/sulfonate/bicarbonate transport system substrate-binding protein
MTSIIPIPSAPDEIWFSRCPTPTTFGLALQRGVIGNRAPGFAQRRWLALQQSPNPATQRAHFTHAKGRCFRHGGNVPPIWARSEGAATRLIGLSWMLTPQPILALPESGIRDVRDLRGKRLLVMTRPESEIDFWQAVTLRVYEIALASAGMGFGDVILVRIPSARPDVVRADASANDPRSLWPLLAMSALNRETLLPLVRGEVDAVVSQGHNAMQLAALLGATIVFDQGTLPDAQARVNNDVPDALTVSADLLDDDPDFVVDVLVALLETEAWVRGHETEAARLLAPELNISEQLLGIAYGGAIGPGAALDLSVERIAAIGAQKEFLLRHGFITRDFDLDRWLDPQPLAAARQRLAARAGQVGAPAA